jgi:hypothetical protein
VETPQKVVGGGARVRAGGVGDGVAAGAAAASSVPKPAPAAGRKRKVDEANGAGPAPSPGSGQKKGLSGADKDNQLSLRSALATKTLYNKVSTVHTSRMLALSSDPEWADLATPAPMSRLKKLYDDMVMVCNESFASEFLHNELVDLKKIYKDDMSAFYFNTKNFEGMVAPKVKSLETEQVRLNRMFLAGKATTK